jgi:site-specific recombinase XerD
MLELTPRPCGPVQDLSTLVAQTERFFKAGKSIATIEAYDADLRAFLSFCTEHGLPYLPSTVQTVALYVGSLAAADPPLAYSTIRRRLASITYAHHRRGLESPATPRNHFLLREVMAGIKRTLGAAQHGADALLIGDIQRIVAACPDSLLGIRDRALILLGFAMGARRAELARAIEVGELTFSDQGLSFPMPQHKTQMHDDHPELVVISRGEHEFTCPIEAVRTWIETADIKSGALFRAVDRHGNVSSTPLAPRSIAKILARALARAGGVKGRISPHSLRVGMCTQAAINGAEERNIQRSTRHRSTAMVRRYIRDSDPYRDNASGTLGL